MARGAMRLNVDRAGGLAVETSVNGSVWADLDLIMTITGFVGSHGLYYPHAGQVPMVTGSESVFITGQPACREEDFAECGHQATGSESVFIN